MILEAVQRAAMALTGVCVCGATIKSKSKVPQAAGVSESDEYNLKG